MLPKMCALMRTRTFCEIKNWKTELGFRSRKCNRTTTWAEHHYFCYHLKQRARMRWWKVSIMGLNDTTTNTMKQKKKKEVLLPTIRIETWVFCVSRGVFTVKKNGLSCKRPPLENIWSVTRIQGWGLEKKGWYLVIIRSALTATRGQAVVEGIAQRLGRL